MARIQPFFMPPPQESLPCVALAQIIERKFGVYIPRNPAAPENKEPADGSDTDTSDEGGAADLQNALLWRSVGRLDWRLRSSGAFTEAEVAARVQILRRKQVRAALNRLAAALRAARPALAAHGRDVLLQVVAAGKDMVTAVTESPDLCEYIAQNELQAIDLNERVPP